MTAMNETMRAAFTTGSGVAPDALKGTLTVICISVVLLICAWVAAQLLNAWQSEEIGTGEMALGLAKTLVLAALLTWVIA